MRRISNGAIAMLLVGIVAGAAGLAYASVPLYRLFCQVTGYGGTTQVATAAPTEVGARKVTVRFNADTYRDLPWSFAAAQREVTVAVGESTLAFYTATNRSSAPITGTATYNVTPQKAGRYFDKLACFCFEEQTLAPGATVEMPVSFFVDPAISDDPNMDDVTTITLSYTFFRAAAPQPEAASVNTEATAAAVVN
jgi:cytochrome c oxidase assembly protein subunit 11